MSEIRQDGAPFVGYEYKELPPCGDKTSLYLDSYQCFGWTLDEHAGEDACMAELDELEHSRTARATGCAVTMGLIGTAFLAGATFAATHTPPLILLTVLLAIPGFVGWVLPYFLYHWMVRRRAKVVDQLMERKYDEIYEICEKGHQLLV